MSGLTQEAWLTIRIRQREMRPKERNELECKAEHLDELARKYGFTVVTPDEAKRLISE